MPPLASADGKKIEIVDKGRTQSFIYQLLVPELNFCFLQAYDRGICCVHQVSYDWPLRWSIQALNIPTQDIAITLRQGGEDTQLK